MKAITSECHRRKAASLAAAQALRAVTAVQTAVANAADAAQDLQARMDMRANEQRGKRWGMATKLVNLVLRSPKHWAGYRTKIEAKTLASVASVAHERPSKHQQHARTPVT